MSTINPVAGRWLAATGGLLLIAALFLPWTAGRSGWETLTTWDVFVLLTGVCGVAAGLTGGRRGFFRPDLSFNAMTDIFGVVLMVLIPWWLLVDRSEGAGAEAGAWLALAGATAVASGAGDFRVRSLFPRVPSLEASPPRSP